MERVARTYDGWCPVVGKPDAFKRDIAQVKKLAAERGRKPESLYINGFVAPREDGLSLDDLRLYADAGADRIVLFSQKDAIEMAKGKTLDIVKRLASTVERAQHI